MAGSFYVTTPIYYVNDVPHLGTAYSTVVVDALRRYHLLRGEDARMLTGTDEHGQKIEREAKARGLTPQAFTDGISQRFREAWPALGVASDDFIRTTEPRHVAFAQALWTKIAANGYLYKGNYEDWYCVGCESYKTEKELLPGNECPLHPGKPVERVKEETYFFKLEAFQERLLDLYARRPELVQPEARRNEVLSFVQGGLRDLSVSRTSFSWGIPVPGDPKHIMYVWFDALTNYLSALQGDDATGEPLGRFWPHASGASDAGGSKARAVHVVGKDILRFHTVYWPAFLLAAGYTEDELPSAVFAHGFLTVNGQKMSKSLRNAVNPLDLAKHLGADVLRYQLLRAIAFGQDGDFDHAAMIERYNADLAKNLGNLLSRTIGLCARLTAGKAPVFPSPPDAQDAAFWGEYRDIKGRVERAWEELAPHRALEATMELSSLGNRYVDHAAPWAQAKQGNQARIEAILATLLAWLETLSVLVWPVMPAKSDEMRAQLGLPKVAPKVGTDLLLNDSQLASGGGALAASVLFPTIDKDRERALLDLLVPKVEGADAAARGVDLPPGTDKKIDKPAAHLTDDAAPAAITYDDFARVDLRVGVVLTAERVPRKDKLLKLSVDLGEPSPRTIIAGLALSFAPEALVGRRVVVVANLAPRDFGKGLVSHGMLLATGASEALTLATVPEGVFAMPGARLK